MFRKILIANRGEIAVRISRACRELGVRSAAVYSDVDRASLHVRLADEAYAIGPAPARESYLSLDKILSVARAAGCDAIHPGYGFLSENASFSRACADAHVTFIGPSPEAMEQLGSKTAARRLAREMWVPTVAGSLDPIETAEDALEAARKIGFPVVLKAVAGGGGKGMRLVSQKSELVGAWRDASSEAQNAFGDGRLYLEKYLPRPRHIEIQVLGDQHGHLLYLGERECSVQRRYQKVIEEAPSPVVTPELRSEMGEAAVKLARAGGYTNAGTVEFLLDVDDHFYFLEMNTRLQVEHPVTEMVTSLDLVKLQIRIAAGEPLPFAQQDVSISGHAIECRIYAEDPENNFFPSPGTILEQRPPTGPGIRMDDGIYPGWTVPGDYDPMLGKLIAWGSDRAEAIARMRRALHEYYITGIRTNISLFRRILNDPDFQRGEVYTSWLDDFLQRPVATISSMVDPRPESASEKSGSPSQAETAAVLAAALWHSSHATSTSGSGSNHEHNPSSTWKTEGRIEQMAREPLR